MKSLIGMYGRHFSSRVRETDLYNRAESLSYDTFFMCPTFLLLCSNRIHLTSILPIIAFRSDSGRTRVDHVRTPNSVGREAGDHSEDPGREPVQGHAR